MNNLSISPAALLFIYCAFVLLASLAGGWLLLGMRLTHARLQTAVSFVAGLMLSMALLHFIPHAVHQNHSVDQTVRWALGGFLVMFFLQRFFPHHHHDVSDGAPESGDLGVDHEAKHSQHFPTHTLEEESASQLAWAATTVGMTLHSLVGGVALAAAVAADSHEHGGLVGLGTALVIILHKPFDAMAVSTLMAASGCSRFSRHLLNALFALATPLGAVLFYVGASHFASANPGFLGSALAFCAGTFLCIACADLLPELQFHSHDRVKLSLALLGGIGIAVLIGLFEASGHDHHEHEFSSVQTHERWLGPTRKLVGSAAKNAPGRFDFTPRPGL
jgi:zinc and cadmium transporter